jgi:hypothetical protein
MKIIKKKHTHYVNDHMNIDVDLLKEVSYNVYIVYYVNCLINPNFMDWITNQLAIVYNFDAKIYVIATIETKKEKSFRRNVLKLFPKVKIECNSVNEFEYRGILKVWELGQKHNKSNDIILYFHSKGLSHHTQYEQNRHDNYNIILKDLDLIKEIFTIFPQIDKVGYWAGGNGWIWYNFWYVRGSYVCLVEKPIKTTRRHYYEDWIARKVLNIEDLIQDSERQGTEKERGYDFYQNTLNKCYGFFTDEINYGNIGSYYDPVTDMPYLI